MKLEDQCVSLELAKRLKEFGVKQDSAFYWWLWKSKDSPHVDHKEENEWRLGFDVKEDVYSHKTGLWRDSERISAFTVAELGEMLNGITITRVEHACSESGRLWSLTQHHWWMLDPNFLAEIICHLIEKGIVKP